MTNLSVEHYCYRNGNSRIIGVVAAVFFIFAFVADSTAQIPESGSRGRGRGGSSSSTEVASIEGRVVLPSGNPVNERVRITLSTANDPGVAVFTDNNGAFIFNNLRAANYSIEAQGDPKRFETATEQVRLQRGMRMAGVIITLREKGTEAKVATGRTVTVGELDNNVPGPARKEFDQATNFASEGKTIEAIDSYSKAIALHPKYLMAHNDLGVQYLKVGRLSEARDHFEAALEINAKAFNPNLNLGIVLVREKKFSDAIERLNQALALDSSSASAHLYSGIAAVETDDLPTGERELSAALSIGGAEFSISHFYLAILHMKNGDREKALHSLNAYLTAQPDGEQSARAKKLIEQLKQE